MSIPIHGGRWSAELQAGIARRSMNDSPTASAGDIVASSDIQKLIIYYTDLHDVDEDLTAIINYGGGKGHGTRAGVTCRSMDNPPDLLDLVASV